MATGTLVQEGMFAVSLTVGGEPIAEPFDKFDGGDVDSNAKTYRAGGMAEAEALPAPAATGEITIMRAFRAERDGPLEKWLIARVGAECHVGKQALRPDKTPVAGALTNYRGVIKGVGTPKVDSEGESVTMLAVTITVHGLPS